MELVKELFDDEEISEIGIDEAWVIYVDNQEMGDCQGICHIIEDLFKNHTELNVKRIFGLIQIDEEVYDSENDEYSNTLTHNWIEKDGEIFEFSKGTLKYYIQFDDIYDPYCEDDSIYL